MKFYEQVFGWTFREVSPGLFRAKTGAAQLRVRVQKIAADSDVRAGVVWFCRAHDLEGTEFAIREAGGSVLASTLPSHDESRHSIFVDPDGNQLAIEQTYEAARKLEKKARRRAEKADAERERAAAEAARSDKKARKRQELRAKDEAARSEKRARKDEKKRARIEADAARAQKKSKKRASGFTGSSQPE